MGKPVAVQKTVSIAATKVAHDPMNVFKAMYKDLDKQEKKEKKVAKLVTNKKEKKKEAVSASAQPGQERPAAQINMHQSAGFQTAGDTISGPIYSKDGRKFRVILIQEGMGNLKDSFYYTKEALYTAAPLFEGKKFFVDHPDAAEEINRPERSVKDVAGYFENCSVEEHDGRAALVGDLVVFESEKCAWVRDLLKKCVNYRERHPGELVGLSINAGGEAVDWELEEFLRQGKVPANAADKLNQAREKGITIIKVVKQFQSAVSCDLVTEAGAGGRVIKMLEQEKTMAKKHVQSEEKKVESEEKKHESEEKHHEDEAKKHESEEADGEEKPHDDEEQDAELIKKMMKKHLGDKDAEEACEADHKVLKNAWEAAKSWGMEGDEAEKAACYGMKMAKHFSKEAEEKHEGEEKKESGHPAGGPGKVGVVGKESETQVIALSAENAKLKESLRKYEISNHLDKTLKESGMSRQVTDTFRKLVEGAKTSKEIDDKFGVFKEAYGLGSESKTVSFMIAAEKEESLKEGEKTLSFAACIRE